MFPHVHDPAITPSGNIGEFLLENSYVRHALRKPHVHDILYECIEFSFSVESGLPEIRKICPGDIVHGSYHGRSINRYLPLFD